MISWTCWEWGRLMAGEDKTVVVVVAYLKTLQTPTRRVFAFGQEGSSCRHPVAVSATINILTLAFSRQPQPRQLHLHPFLVPSSSRLDLVVSASRSRSAGSRCPMSDRFMR
jgi:hypothetical protein